MLTLSVRGDMLVASLADASAEFCRRRDASGEGASRFPGGRVYDASGKLVATITYNGRVWSPEWTEGDAPLFDPYKRS